MARSCRRTHLGDERRGSAAGGGFVPKPTNLTRMKDAPFAPSSLRETSSAGELSPSAEFGLPIEVLNHPNLSVGRRGDAARDRRRARVGHVVVVAVGRALARAFGEHHGEAAIGDGLERAVPAGAFVLRALAALAERAVDGAGRAVGACLRAGACFAIGASRDGSDADAAAACLILEQFLRAPTP